MCIRDRDAITAEICDGILALCNDDALSKLIGEPVDGKTGKEKEQQVLAFLEISSIWDLIRYYKTYAMPAQMCIRDRGNPHSCCHYPDRKRRCRQYRGIFPACPDRKECPERWRKHHRNYGGLCAAKRNAAGRKHLQKEGSGQKYRDRPVLRPRLCRVLRFGRRRRFPVI